VAKKSIYETSFAAGHTGGLYEAELQGVGDVWSDIEASQSMTALKGERRGAKLDTILSGLELTSQVAGGLQARGEFQGSLKTVAGDIDPSGDTSFEKVKVGGLKKLFQEPSYKIGDKVMSKSDISIAGEMIKYGGTPKYDRFKFKPDNAAQELVDNDQLSSKSVKSDDVGGKFYGERKGFDIGDIVGEKSIFAAGKQKLSSILSPDKPPQAGGAPKTDDLAEKRKAVSDANKQRRESEKLRKAKEAKQKELDKPVTKGLGDLTKDVASVVIRDDTGKDVPKIADPVISQAEKTGSGNLMDRTTGGIRSMWDMISGIW